MTNRDDNTQTPTLPSETVEPSTKAHVAARIAPRPTWPRPATSAHLHPALWGIRVVMVLAEPFRLCGRVIRCLLEEPRYASARPGQVTVRRSLAEGLGIEPLWHPHQRIFGGFAWGADDDRRALAYALLTDYLGAAPDERLCVPFARRAFARVVHAHDPWTLTTLQIEQALRLTLMELDSTHAADTMAA